MNKRLLYLCLCLFCLPLLVGCDDIAKANETNKPGEKAKADSTSTDGSKKTKRTPLEFSELPANDPLVANAIQAREQIIELEDELLDRLDELRSVLASAKADPERMRQSVESFIDLTKEMRQKTTQANEAINSVSEKTAELSRSSRHLASSYRALANLFRLKAKDYSEKKLRDQLNGFAKDYDDVAHSIPERTKALDAVQKKLPSLKRKVKEVNSFLTDAVSFLNSHPGIGADPREKYSGEFESFAVTFTEWIRVLEELRAALREKAISKVIQEGYRKDVLAWQKLEEAKREEQVRLERVKEELAKAEQAKRDEQVRLVKIAEEEQRKLTDERERLVKEREKLAAERERLAKADPARDQPKPLAVSQPTSMPATSPVFLRTFQCPQTQCYVSTCPQPYVCQSVRPCRVRLFPLFRRD